ncbi:nucleotidyl transferase AbiEii/AbiGii toxin family protein [Novosphingobium decolorationis]|nr:nucleotidyl transferase AbiEii/AbiGii toxin family protein [Novosphingobium decolorationis]
MDPVVEIVDVDVRAWVENARADPQLYRDRQVTEIVLAAIGLSPSLNQSLVLKGGTLMALAFGSRRVTGDVDFSATVPPDGFDDLLRDELNAKFRVAAIKLGYLDLVCRVQGVKRRPHSNLFENAEFPALELRVGSAERGSKQEAALAEGKASRILFVEVSFRDQVYAFQELNLGQADAALRAFTLAELIAEKLRALLQQPIRNRNRRQDVYDIALLLDDNPPDDALRTTILETLIEKCRSREIEPTRESIDDPEVAKRAQRDWETLRLEVSDLPPFEERFAAVREFYHSLPW